MRVSSSLPRTFLFSFSQTSLKSHCRCSNAQDYGTSHASYQQWRFFNLTPEDSRLLQCLSQNRLRDARQLLDKSSDRGGRSRVVHSTSLVTKFSKSGHVGDARKLFDLMPERNVVTYNAMLSGYVGSGMLSEAFRFFEEMPVKNTVSWTLLLCGLADAGRVSEALRLFDSMPERNIVSWNSMVSGLIKNGDLERARIVFDQMPARNIVSWNAMISGYSEGCKMEEARVLFNAMRDRNVVTWTSMISGYCRSGFMDDGYSLFRGMPERNVVSWTAMISGYTWNGFYEEALLLFMEWKKCSDVKPNREAFVSLAYACAGVGLPSLGKQLHAQVILSSFDKEDCDGRLTRGLIHMYSTFGYMRLAHFIFISTSHSYGVQYCSHMINGYIRSRQLDMAESLFNKLPIQDKVSCTAMITGYLSVGEVSKACHIFRKMPDKDAVACTAMISGHVHNELFVEANAIFSEMRAQSISPLNSTYCALLGAMGAMACLDPGRQLHCLVIKTQCEFDTILDNSLISMYAKCGEINDAHSIFSGMVLRDVISWNSMIMGFSNHGLVHKALKTFGMMLQSETPPDSVTFLGILSACSHSGTLSKGLEFFNSMTDVYAIQPGLEHYICIIDLLGRAGKVKEAYEFVLRLPFEPGNALWGALLGICGLGQTNAEIACCAAKRLLELDPLNGPAHVALCNIYAANNLRGEERMLRKQMGVKGVRKAPGCSWIQMRERVLVFLSGDKVDQEVEEMLWLLFKSV